MSEVKPRIDFAPKGQEIDEEYQKIQRDFATVAATEEGRAVLRAVKYASHIGLPCAMEGADGDIAPYKMAFMNGKQAVWMALRAFIPHEQLVQIELPQPKPVKLDDV